MLRIVFLDECVGFVDLFLGRIREWILVERLWSALDARIQLTIDAFRRQVKHLMPVVSNKTRPLLFLFDRFVSALSDVLIKSFTNAISANQRVNTRLFHYNSFNAVSTDLDHILSVEGWHLVDFLYLLAV